MKPIESQVLCAVVAAALTLVAASPSAAEEPNGGPETAQQLQRNVHDIRVALDRERAQLEANKRANAPGLVVESRDAPGIGLMRQQLAQQLEHLESRCFGIDVEVHEGNAMVICGSNNGEAENSNVTTDARTTVVVVPPPSESAPSAEQPAPPPSFDAAVPTPVAAEDAP
jgi:hypothetical protein